MKVCDLVQLLKASGWDLAHTRGEHRRYTHKVLRGAVTLAGEETIEILGKPPKVVKTKRVKIKSGTEFVVVVEKGANGYGAYVPDLPGCVALAKGKKAVVDLIRDAIEFHLEVLRHDPRGILLTPTAVRFFDELPRDRSDLVLADGAEYPRPKRWFCCFCGRQSGKSQNASTCKFCKQRRPFLGVSITMILCVACHEWSVGSAAYCEWCGAPIRGGGS